MTACTGPGLVGPIARPGGIPRAQGVGVRAQGDWSVNSRSFPTTEVTR